MAARRSSGNKLPRKLITKNSRIGRTSLAPFWSIFAVLMLIKVVTGVTVTFTMMLWGFGLYVIVGFIQWVIAVNEHRKAVNEVERLQNVVDANEQAELRRLKTELVTLEVNYQGSRKPIVNYTPAATEPIRANTQTPTREPTNKELIKSVMKDRKAQGLGRKRNLPK